MLASEEGDNLPVNDSSVNSGAGGSRHLWGYLDRPYLQQAAAIGNRSVIPYRKESNVNAPFLKILPRLIDGTLKKHISVAKITHFL